MPLCRLHRNCHAAHVIMTHCLAMPAVPLLWHTVEDSTGTGIHCFVPFHE